MSFNSYKLLSTNLSTREAMNIHKNILHTEKKNQNNKRPLNNGGNFEGGVQRWSEWNR